MDEFALRPKFTKLQAVEDHLHAAALLFLGNRNSVSVHTLVVAAKQILLDLAKVRPVSVVSRFDAVVNQRLRPGYEKEWRRYEKRASNFFKHADKDPDELLDGVDLDSLNSIELLITILIFFETKKEMSASLWLLLFVVSFENEKCFETKGLFEQHNEITYWLAELKALSKHSRRRRCLEVVKMDFL